MNARLLRAGAFLALLAFSTAAAAQGAGPNMALGASTTVGGQSFAPSAFVDATNAANIASGTLPAARLPAPTASTRGGVESVAQVAHEVVSYIDAGGAPHLTQLSFADIAGTASASQVPAIGALSGLGSGVGTALGYGLNAQNGVPSVYSASLAVGHCLQWGPGVQDSGSPCGAQSGLGAPPPQGRLTLVSGTPVPTQGCSGCVGAGGVYFTPDLGASLPEWSATLSGWSNQPSFAELYESLSDTTYAPAAAVANAVYDEFVCVIGGSLELSRGPAWTNASTRSLGLTRVGGFLVNAAAYANGCPSQQGLFVGTIATDPSAATVSFNPRPAPASGGPAGGATVGIWNEFNRASVALDEWDNNASWAYSTASTWRPSDNSTNNRLNFVVGWPEDDVFAHFSDIVSESNSTQGAIGVGLNSVSAPSSNGPSMYGVGNSGAVWNGAAPLTAVFGGAPALGRNYLQALEYTTSSNTFYGVDYSQQQHQLSAQWRY
jgi:hypothetical protein